MMNCSVDFRPQSRFFVSLIAIVFAFQANASEQCLLIQHPEGPPFWSASGVWTPGGEIVFVDANFGALIEYSVTGESAGEIASTALHRGFRLAFGPHEFPFEPLLASSWDGRIAVLNESNDLVWFEEVDRRLKIHGHSPLTYRSPYGVSQPPTSSAALRLDVLYDFAFVNESTVLVFADVQEEDGGWRTGFFMIKLNDTAPTPVPVLVQSGKDSRESGFRGYYSSTNRYLATVETLQVAAAIQFSSSPQIVVFDQGSLLNGAPKYEIDMRRMFEEASSHGVAPLGPVAKDRWITTTDLEERAEKRSELDLIAGLYSDGEDVFVVRKSKRAPDARTRGRSLGTVWTAARVDLNSRSITGEIDLPTTAPDVIIAAGADSWAIFEKEMVFRERLQKMGQLAIFPSSWFDEVARGKSESFLIRDQCKRVRVGQSD